MPSDAICCQNREIHGAACARNCITLSNVFGHGKLSQMPHSKKGSIVEWSLSSRGAGVSFLQFISGRSAQVNSPDLGFQLRQAGFQSPQSLQLASEPLSTERPTNPKSQKGVLEWWSGRVVGKSLTMRAVRAVEFPARYNCVGKSTFQRFRP